MRKMIVTAITILGLVGALGTPSLAYTAKKATKKADATACPLKGTPACPLTKKAVTKKGSKKDVPPCCAKQETSAAK